MTRARDTITAPFPLDSARMDLSALTGASVERLAFGALLAAFHANPRRELATAILESVNSDDRDVAVIAAGIIFAVDNPETKHDVIGPAMEALALLDVERAREARES